MEAMVQGEESPNSSSSLYFPDQTVLFSGDNMVKTSVVWAIGIVHEVSEIEVAIVIMQRFPNSKHFSNTHKSHILLHQWVQICHCYDKVLQGKPMHAFFIHMFRIATHTFQQASRGKEKQNLWSSEGVQSSKLMFFSIPFSKRYDPPFPI